MDWVETTGKTIEEAKEAALDVLGVDYSEAEFELVEEAKQGFLGLNKKEARVRARVRPTSPRAKDGRRPHRRRSSKGSDEGTGNGSEERSTTPPRSNVRNSGRDIEAGKTREAPRATRSRRTNSEERSVKVSENNELSKSREADPIEIVPTVTRVELAGLVQRFLADLLHELELAGTVTVDHLDDESIELAITGEDLGVLIGHRGSVISSVQELTRAVAQRVAGESTGRVSVDVAGFRRKRKEALERFIQRQVEAVISSGSELALEPMSAADRKIAHDTVAEMSGVSTRSMGNEPSRYVVIQPGDADPELSPPSS